MAKISITFSGVVHYTDATNKVESKDDITLATDKVGCDAFPEVFHEHQGFLFPEKDVSADGVHRHARHRL